MLVKSHILLPIKNKISGNEEEILMLPNKIGIDSAPKVAIEKTV